MEKNKQNRELDTLIRDSMMITDVPSQELNTRLKMDLYRHEATLCQQTSAHAISFLYLPMVVSFATFSLLTVLALLMIANPYLSVFLAALCGYAGVASIALTVIGVKRTRIKEDMTLHIKKRGSLA